MKGIFSRLIGLFGLDFFSKAGIEEKIFKNLLDFNEIGTTKQLKHVPLEIRRSKFVHRQYHQ